ncbi:MAG: class I SAM-dependent methyltransferase [Defluviitaleaceae bacterium]|nr:class I SAM-dependent methyltransferase [Defluviitaleaceae bacterium]
MDELINYYEDDYNEHVRLFKDNYHQVEYLTTIHFLDKYISPKSRILDACAGTGIYAFHLAKHGHAVTACDLVGGHVEIMRKDEKAGSLEDIRIANVLDMSEFENGTFDVVMCMGALYHLMHIKERRECIKECLRILKPNGLAIFSYINRNAVYIHKFARNSGNSESRAQVMENGINGIFYGMDFDEANNLFDEFPMEKIDHIGTSGITYPLYQQLNSLNQEDFAAYMKYHLATCRQPSILGHSMHGLFIGTKK